MSMPRQSGKYTVAGLDAQTVDVYKGTHGVLLLMDPTKKWTFDYVQRELQNIPNDLHVLLLVKLLPATSYHRYRYRYHRHHRYPHYCRILSYPTLF